MRTGRRVAAHASVCLSATHLSSGGQLDDAMARERAGQSPRDEAGEDKRRDDESACEFERGCRTPASSARSSLASPLAVSVRVGRASPRPSSGVRVVLVATVLALSAREQLRFSLQGRASLGLLRIAAPGASRALVIVSVAVHRFRHLVGSSARCSSALMDKEKRKKPPACDRCKVRSRLIRLNDPVTADLPSLPLSRPG